MIPESPRQIAIDRERGRASFERFVRIAWPHVCPDPLRWSWHMSALCAHLEAVTRGEIRDLVICVPPGASKSLIASTFWPAWTWIEIPSERFLCATYGQDLSDKNAKLHRDLVLTDWYQARWGDRAQIGKDDAARVREFGNTAKGWRISTSIGGRATGIHAGVHIGDDLAKAQDASGRAYVDPVAIEKANDFWFSTMATRRADAATLRRVMIGQRLHHDDTPGRCIAAGYTALVLPMEYDPARHCSTPVRWTPPRPDGLPGHGPPVRFSDPRTEKGDLLIPDRFPREVVDADKSPTGGLGPLVHEAQNQQNPTPVEGVIFKNAGAHRWTTLPTRNAVKIITVDATFKDKKSSDFVAIHVWIGCGPNFYLVDRAHGRMGITATIQAILTMRERHPGAAVYVEDKANGPAIVEVLKAEVSGVLEWSPGQDSKESRARAMAHLVEAGNVYFPPDDVAPWIGEVLTTIKRFPLVKYDDDVDAMVMALRILYVPGATSYANMVAGLRGKR